MIKNKKIIVPGILLLILCGGVFLWLERGGYGQEKGSERESLTENMLGNENQADEGTDEDEGEETLDADDPLNIPETEAEAKKTSAYVVDKQVCENECVLYKDDQEALAYCQAVCGFAPTEGGRREAPKDCNNRTETDRDICLRDKAVAEKNASLCNDIIDQGLRQSCHNRVAEEYFDQ